MGMAVYSVLFTKRRLCLLTHPPRSPRSRCGNLLPPRPQHCIPHQVTLRRRGGLSRWALSSGLGGWRGTGKQQAVDPDLHKITGLQPEPEHM